MNHATADQSTLAAIFGEPIHVYTREQAVEDGVLVDAHLGDLADVTRQHVGGNPCYISAGLWALIEQAVAHPRWCNDYRGVWHDILWMSTGARRYVARQGGGRAGFEVIITGTGRRRLHMLSVAWDGDALTYMLPSED